MEKIENALLLRAEDCIVDNPSFPPTHKQLSREALEAYKRSNLVLYVDKWRGFVMKNRFSSEGVIKVKS